MQPVRLGVVQAFSEDTRSLPELPVAVLAR